MAANAREQSLVQNKLYLRTDLKLNNDISSRSYSIVERFQSGLKSNIGMISFCCHIFNLNFD